MEKTTKLIIKTVKEMIKDVIRVIFPKSEKKETIIININNYE